MHYGEKKGRIHLWGHTTLPARGVTHAGYDACPANDLHANLMFILFYFDFKLFSIGIICIVILICSDF